MNADLDSLPFLPFTRGKKKKSKMTKVVPYKS